MTSSLDKRIRAALSGQLRRGGAQDFAADPSAVAKANQVLETIRREDFDASHAAFINIGGADGSELEHLLLGTDARYGVLLEYDDQLSEKARERSRTLQDSSGKRMEVLTGDALQKVDPALCTLDEWRKAGEVRSIILTMHAVLHEFPNRGAGTTDIEGFLQKFLWRQLPVLAVAREPCMPEGLPPTVYLAANCRPDILAELAKRVRSAHSEFLSEMEPAAMARKVRMGSRLAIETLVKLFYIESLSYEIEERITSFTKQELVGAFRNVFGTENVRTEAFQTDSLDRFWRALGIVMQDEDQRELPKPEVHVRIVAKWLPPGSTPPAHKPSSGVPRDAEHTPSGGTAVTRPVHGGGSDTRGAPASASGDAQSPDGAAVVPLPPSSLRPAPPFDLWTPGSARHDIVVYYEPIVGRETAERLWDLSQAAISAVANGDFQRQVAIGRELRDIAPDNIYLKAEGEYFEAEGLRLLADVERSPEKMTELRELAFENYHRASEALPQDPRPVRGIGRLLDVQGKYDDALRYLVRAKGLCLTGLASTDAMCRPDLAHEMLRTARHLIHCLLDVRTTNPLSKWHRENKRHELEGLLVECENYHREYMPIFQIAESWWQIEWFMGLVFLARAWAQLGRPERARQCLVYALDMRRKLIGRNAQLSAVERANLRWWLAVAKDRTTAFDSRSYELIDRLAAAVEQGDRQSVRLVIDDLLVPALPPWDQGDSP